jgi:hypothetical protein
VVFDYSYYSAPYRLVGEELWVRAMPQRVELYKEWERVATHQRAVRRGEWKTNPTHLPEEKLLGLLPAPLEVRAQAAGIGRSTAEFIDELLGQRPLDRLRSAQGVLRLAKRVGSARLEAACRRALEFDEVRYHTVKNILNRGLDLLPLASAVETAEAGPLPKTSVYARSIQELFPVQPN